MHRMLQLGKRSRDALELLTRASYFSTTALRAAQETASFGYEDVPFGEKKARVEGVFGSVAESYDVMNDLMSGGLHRLWKERLVIKVNPFPGMRHLDVAGGTGDVAKRIKDAIQRACKESARHLHDPTLQNTGTVTVCDINLAMLDQGKQKLENLPFRDGSMDAYTIAFGLRNVTDIPRALTEAYRVLKPGGKFLCLEFSEVSIQGLKQIYDAYSFNVIPLLGRMVANDEQSYKYLVESIRRFPRQELLVDLMLTAGFDDVRYENLTGGIVAIHTGFKYPGT